MRVEQRTLRIALAGNPNAGKTTLFNRLTGSRAKVGNYPGVTVERAVGRWRTEALGEVELMDVPGMISLSTRSEEEQVAFGAVAGIPPHDSPDAVVVVVDACELARQLYLVLQVLELGRPTVVALSMVDQLEADGRTVDTDLLERELGVPVVPVGARVDSDGETLANAVARAAAAVASANATGQAPDREHEPWPWSPRDPQVVEDLDVVAQAVPQSWHRDDPRRRRALATWALISLADAEPRALAEVPLPLREAVAARARDAEHTGRDVDEVVVRARYAWIDALYQRLLRPRAAAGPAPAARAAPASNPESLTGATPCGPSAPCAAAATPNAAPGASDRTDRIDRVLLHPVFGFAIFLVVMTVVFQALFTLADPMIGWIEDGVGLVAMVVGGVLPDGLVRDFLVDGVIAGVGAVLAFLPQILMLFFFIAVLEQSGYMARVAFLMDRVMKMVGLHGRAFLPMLSGFACAVPAIMATRTIERRRDRLLTMLVIPLMTCSARLPVYGLLIAALYPPNQERPFVQGMLMVAMYLFSTVIALIAAAVLGRTLLRGPKVPLILQMPRYRKPHLRTVTRQMVDRSMVFVREAGTIILACTIVMWVLLTFPREPELETDYPALRAAAETQAVSDGRDAQWLVARFASIDSAEQGERLRLSFAGRLGHAIEPTIEPLGFDWKVGIGLIGAFAAREVFVSTMAVVYGLEEDTGEESPTLRERVREHRRLDGSRVFTPLVCLSLMVFFALACQCLSTLAAARRESGGWGWPVFMFVYMTALAWGASFAVFQGGQLIGWS